MSLSPNVYEQQKKKLNHRKGKVHKIKKPSGLCSGEAPGLKM